MNSQKNFERPSHPREQANFASILTYFWTIPIFCRGFQKDLEEEDLFKPLTSHKSSILGDKLEKAWKKELKLNKNPSLWKALRAVFGLELLLHGFVFVFIELVLKMSQPLALSMLLSCYSEESGTIQQNEALLYAGIIVSGSLGNALAAHWYSLSLQHFGMKVRVACCSLIYRKSLRLSRNAVEKATVGQMVNLLSNDVNRFDKATVHFHSLWFVPIETVIIVYILYRLVGITSAIGVVFLALFVPLQVYLGKRIAKLRLNIALKTDERIQLMNEIISGIQIIKMYTWEKQFTKLITAARKLEINKISAASYIRGIMLSFSIFATRTAIFVTVLIYVLLGNALTAEYVFVTASFYNVLRQAVTRYYPQGISQIGEASISISRLQKFLLYEENQHEIKNIQNEKNSCNGKILTGMELKTLHSNAGVKLLDLSVSASSNKILDSIHFNFESNELVVITGPVGCGKTSLLRAILKELPLETGLVSVKGKISYASQEPWLFAETISQNILFGQSLDRKRYDKVIEVCALVPDIALLPYGDKTIIGERGVTLSGGQRARINLARAIYRNADIYLLDDPLSAVDTHVGKQIFKDCILEFLKNKCVILVTHQLQYLKDFNKVVLMENGKIITYGTYGELNQNGISFNYQNRHVREKILDHSQRHYQYFINHGVKQDIELREVKEHKSEGNIDKDVYVAYMKGGGSFLSACLVLFLFISTQVFSSTSDYFVAHWVNLEQKRRDGDLSSHLTTKNCIYIYAAIISVLIILTLTRSIFFFKFCMDASMKLHNNMFYNIIHVPMNFFNKHSSGRILNRFSKDIGSIDETLPAVIIDCMQIGLIVTGITIVIALVNPWLLVVTGIISILFYMLKIVYIATSRSIKRLEGVTRSPVFTHINASLQGLTTIRAFKAQKVLQKEFDDLQDLHSSAWYLFLSCSTAFGFWLDLICVTYIGIVTFSFLFIKSEQYSGNIGLAITQAISLTGVFQWGMRQWSDLENQMTSVERIMEYTKIPKEPNPEEIAPLSNWPGKGSITFSSVSLRYSPTDPYVLEQLSFSIKSNEKVGIVGRTGAGKSSIVYALFQLTQTEGKILIDDIDINKLPFHILRSHISIIPQEPAMFSGTLRKNLDPFDEYTDLELWKALEEVELKGIIANLSLGLKETTINFSVGQKQLICLARAIIRKNKILILDEATANLDAQTDMLIQKTIKNRFAQCTVLTIAHRIHTIMDSDKVLVIDNRKVVEFDNPYLLLKNKNGLFHSMVKQNGINCNKTLNDDRR
ncbi:hypothetical protein ILUMI_09443 [Ignelater luminosus]|uniref:Uncharacterized protein n=1 Tax=Ignelater luminosus TaxID=2038154 RepID=A0A8K0D489_IGNLU|nr:hypothetical protein ILUMI_09443 [Ignelater luminosus]